MTSLLIAHRDKKENFCPKIGVLKKTDQNFRAKNEASKKVKCMNFHA